MLATLLLTALIPLHASVIGTSQPAEPITAARIATLPPKQRASWALYLQRSEQQRKADQAVLAAERSRLTGSVPPQPKEGFSGRTMNLHREPGFYATPEARHTADTIVSFQLPNGGWSKNIDMSAPARLPGQSWMPNNLSRLPSPGDFDTPANPDWNYAGTLDNDATNTELHFLALVAATLPAHDGDPYRASFLRGIHYLLAAQFPNGGWPQVWPLEGGYHDAITFNDNALTNTATLLTQAADGQYPFVPADLRKQAEAAAARAIDCILAAQIAVSGHRTVWAQQADALTFAPVAGRNYEPASLSSGESADILVFLMHLSHPSPAIIAAVTDGIAWLREHALSDMTWASTSQPGERPNRHLTATPGAPLLWPRYTSLTTGKPIFGDRDKSIHDTVDDLSAERRNGYAWYGSGPQAALDAYAAWPFKK